MNYEIINKISERIRLNRKRLLSEKDGRKREVLKLKIIIDETKLRIERLK